MKTLRQLTSRGLVNRFLPKNFIADNFSHFSKEFQRRIPASYLVKIKLAIISTNGLVIDLANFKLLSDADGSFSFCQFLKLLFKGKVKALRTSNALMVIQKWSIGYFHWITEVLPKLYLVRNEKDFNLLLPDNFDAFHRPSISPYRLSIKKIKNGNVYFAFNLVYITQVAPSGNYNEVLMRSMRKFYFEKFGLNVRVKDQPKKIYISRKKANRRKINNENKLERLLKINDIETHCLEEYTFEKQIRLINESNLIIGLHGAGLSNMIFMPDNSNVFEIRMPNDKTNLCYYSLASALKFKYWYMFSQSENNDLDYNINIDKFHSIIEQITSSSNE